MSSVSILIAAGKLLASTKKAVICKPAKFLHHEKE
jgi:hypothetical protein